MVGNSPLISLTEARRDPPARWTKDFVPAPLGFDAPSFQERIDRLIGLSRGESIIKLVWGGNERHRFYTAWDAFGIPVKEEEKPRFAIKKANSRTGKVEKVPIRRWLLTERSEPEQYRANDATGTTFTDWDGLTKKIREKPRDGYYTPLLIIADHSSCPPNCQATKPCLGDYKHPDEAVLEYLRAAKRFVEDNPPIFNPYESVNAIEAAILSERFNQPASEEETQQILLDAELKAKEFWRIHANKTWFS